MGGMGAAEDGYAVGRPAWPGAAEAVARFVEGGAALEHWAGGGTFL